MDTQNHKLPGLYVHIPFCRSKCPYCDFYSIEATDLIDSYLDALDEEVRRYRSTFPRFDSLYLGGGSPSVLSLKRIERLISSLQACFTFTADAETTIEANPGDLSPELLSGWRATGFTRISLGVQSFVDSELRLLGRRHSAADARSALADSRTAGFDAVCLDLIYGLPGQTAGDWLSTLAEAAGFEPDHISCYQLTLKNDTPLQRSIETGALCMPDDSACGEMFLRASAYLTGCGYLHYEVSNYARGEKFRARHNSTYWEHIPYLGLGPAAHSFDGRKRWWNVSSVEQYCELISSGRSPVAATETITPEQRRLEQLFLGFRTRIGLPLAQLHRDSDSQRALEKSMQEGLLEIRRDRAVSTCKGMLVADSLAQLFV